MQTPAWFSWRSLVLVIIGGAAGAGLRALCTMPFADAAHPLVVPAITLVVNVAGAFGLGLLVAALGERHTRLRMLLGTGLMGGFTTYSAFAVHVSATFTAAPIVGILLAVLTLAGGVFAAGLGLSLGGRREIAPTSPEAAE